MNTKDKSPLPDRTARAALIIPALFFAFSTCSSYKTVRITGEDGRLREARYLEKGAAIGRILMEYDAAGRPSRATRQSLPGGETLITRTFSYDQAGRLRIQTHRAPGAPGGGPAEDAWVESFFYGIGGELIRTETSYKSSHSIARNRTPLVITRFSYNDGGLSGIIQDGTVFRRESTLRYDGKSLVSVEMLFLSRLKSRWKLEPSRHLIFKMDGDRPLRAEDRLAGGAVIHRDEAVSLFAEHGLDAAIDTPAYAAGIRDLPDRLILLWAPK
ncbi:MAG TPA: hypothetical protein PKO25_13015 [Spirochaetota bacterium]|nr:MAG: hypothetical protein BWY96_02527 [Spirochaetes bacterium ADurb.BinA120]HNU92786.1 hypothetical protein [Spirochaetota bacterium]HPI13873.1 hypothetical protein [Spirochaetota bacterium]HPO44934.1 hypothetical protein [Spirochaetota bacterium]